MSNELKCEVCGSTNDVIVTNASSGPWSRAYCVECRTATWVPEDEAENLLFCVPYNDLCKECKDWIVKLKSGEEVTMGEYANDPKTIATLREAEREMLAYFKKLEEEDKNNKEGNNGF